MECKIKPDENVFWIDNKHYGGDNIGKGKRGKQDGTGPHKDSYMSRTGRSGRKAGHKKGKC